MKLFNCKLLINLDLMFDNFFKIRRLFIILLTLFSHDLIARSWRVSQIPNGSVNGCRTCHNSSYRSLNSFGLDVRSVVGRGSTATFWTSILALKDSDSCNTKFSRAFSLEILFAQGRIDEIYKRLEVRSKIDDENITIAAFASFIAEVEKRDTAYNFCPNPIDFIHHSNLSTHINDTNNFIAELIMS